MAQLKDLIVNGITRILGKCYASEFVGKLTGNSDTATKLATARTISLTNSVTGSGTFDGSGNLSISATNKCYRQSATDINTFLPGSENYAVKEFPSDSKNLPSSHWYHVIAIQSADTTFATQLALGMTINAAYYRSYQGGRWQSWVKLTSSGGSYVGSSAPSDTSLLWIDTANSGVLKYYDSSSSSWKSAAIEWSTV